MESRTFYIQTYGCQMNAYEAGVVRRILEEAGYSEVESEKDADVLLMMTCSVRSHAEARAFGRLGAFRALRSQKPGRVIGVLGCMAQRFKESLVQDSRVDIVVGPDGYRKLPELVAQARAGTTGLLAVEETGECYDQVVPKPDSPSCASVTIMRGCDDYCSYCIVPYVKGRERSKPFARVMNEVTHLLNQGVKVITLLGQNVLAYKGGRDFSELLRAVAATGVPRLRFLTSHPRDIDERLLRTMAELPNVCPALHLPLQSGSDRILSQMNRGYNRAGYLRTIELCRGHIPDVSLSTDVLVAFPGETEEDFLETLDVVRRVQFDFAYMFKYSRRPGTKAAELHPKVAEADAGRRLARLIEIQNRITMDRNRRLVGRECELLIEGPSPRGRGLLGRTRQNKVVIYHGDAAVGDVVRCRVTSINGWTPVAEALRPAHASTARRIHWSSSESF